VAPKINRTAAAPTTTVTWSAVAPTTSLVFSALPDPLLLTWTAMLPDLGTQPAPLGLAWSAVAPEIDKSHDPSALGLTWAAPVPTPATVPLVYPSLLITAEPYRYPSRQPPSRLIDPAAWRTRFYGQLRGRYRVFNEACYRFYRSQSAPPQEGDSPYATASSLPATPATTFADGTWYIACSYFNGVIDSGFLQIGDHGECYRVLVLSGGVEVGSPPPGPNSWQLNAQAGGVVRVEAYIAVTGDEAPTQWAIAYTTDGSTPAADTPDVTQAIAEGAGAVLAYSLPAAANGATVKVRLQTRRSVGGSWVYSTGSEVKTLTIDTDGPTQPLAGDRWAGRAAEFFKV